MSFFIVLAVEPQHKRPRCAFDGFRNLKEEQNSNTDSNGFSDSGGGSNSNKSKSLASLFRPPIDLLFEGSFEAVIP